jgi:hypothetical protein
MKPKSIVWTFAKTYAKFAPHEYIVQEEQPDAFKWYSDLVAREGVQEPFTLRGYTREYRYYYEGNYKYWIMGNICNRAKIQ